MTGYFYMVLHADESAELLANLDAKTDEFPSQEDLSGAAMALLRLQDTYALSTDHLAAGNVQGISDSMSMSGTTCNIQLLLARVGMIDTCSRWVQLFNGLF